jgi:hypothetical protein
MAETPASLNDMSRRDLSELAKTLGIADAEVMTRAELRAAIERSQSTPRSAAQPPWPTTWLGVARGLIASIVEQGLNLPDAAALIRGDTKLSSPPKPAAPVATVTLARIYAAQGHLQRAGDTLNEVLRSDPDHELARALHDEFVARKRGSGAAAAPPSSAAAESVEAPSIARPVEPVPASAASALHDAAPVEAPASELPPTIDERAPATAPSAHGPEPEAITAEWASPPLEPARRARVEPPPPTPRRPLKSPEAPPPRLPAVPAPPPARPARVSVTPRPLAAELVLIETDAPAAYLYWELAATARQPVAPEQCALFVVTYAPRCAGAERVERRLAINARSGLVRLTGLPADAVVRARLTSLGNAQAQNGAASPKALAVAGSVRAHEPPLDPAIRVVYCPSRRHNPADLAVRAIERLAEATTVPW